jgi:hypothetical protein
LLAVEELQIKEEKMGWQRSGSSIMLVGKRYASGGLGTN